jgi:hypothetical protein
MPTGLRFTAVADKWTCSDEFSQISLTALDGAKGRSPTHRTPASAAERDRKNVFVFGSRLHRPLELRYADDTTVLVLGAGKTHPGRRGRTDPPATVHRQHLCSNPI